MSIVINKQLKIPNEKPAKLQVHQKYTDEINSHKSQKEQNIPQNMNQPISQKKPHNETSSKISKTPQSCKDIFNNMDELKNFLKTNCKEFLEKFELLDFLKNGSAGSVIKAHPKIRGNKAPSNRLIALKFLYNGKNKKGNQDHSEIYIHGALKHKNIPPIFGYYKIGDNSCIAMEMCFYGDIENFKKNIIKRTSFSESLLLYITGGIVEALHYIHTNYKIIHMDIKPQNILIDDYLMIKLTDFSVSINYKKNTDYIELPLWGTCYYMSPEVLGKQTILVEEASKIDVYSLGVLLYYYAFCDYPYNLSSVNNKDYKQIEKNIQENSLEIPKDTGHSELFANFLKKCLNKNIKERYNVYEIMDDPWYKGYKIILNEKEKLYNAGKFLIDLMVDNLLPLNEYIKGQEQQIMK